MQNVCLFTLPGTTVYWIKVPIEFGAMTRICSCAPTGRVVPFNLGKLTVVEPNFPTFFASGEQSCPQFTSTRVPRTVVIDSPSTVTDVLVALAVSDACAVSRRGGALK